MFPITYPLMPGLSPSPPPPLCVSLSPCAPLRASRGSVPVWGMCAELWLRFCRGTASACVCHFSAWEGAGFPVRGPLCRSWRDPWRWVHEEGLSTGGGTFYSSQLWAVGSRVCKRHLWGGGGGEWTLLQSPRVGSGEQELAAELRRPLWGRQGMA